MAIYQMDSSGIVKHYIHEIGSVWGPSITNPAIGNDIFTARATCEEVVSAITRRTRGGRVPSAAAVTAIATFKNDWQNECQIIEVTEALINRAINLAETHGWRGYDTIQFAAACEIHNLCAAAGDFPPPIFVSADTELNAVVISERLMVDEPNSHP